MPPQQPGNLQNSKAMNDAEAKRKIETLKNRLESGDDFGALAMNFSENPNTAGMAVIWDLLQNPSCGRTDGVCRDHQAEARADDGHSADLSPRFQAAVWISDFQADRP